VIELLVIFPSPHLEALACPSTPKVLQARERAPTLYSSIVFHFRLTFESIKELRSVSHGMRALIELDSFVGSSDGTKENS
jgi:hypothetical protein